MFAAGRAFEQVRNSIGYTRLNVKIGATHAGISVGEDGASHQCLEDIALMRTIPGMVVINPADDREAQAAVKAAIDHDGPVYMRFGRLAVEDINDDNYKFELGRGVLLKDGGDVTASLYMDNIEENGKSEGEGFHLVFATNKAARSTSLSFTYFEDYLYEDDLYEDIVDYTLTYLAGETVTDETGTTYPGKVLLDVNQDGETITVGLETELRVYVSDQAYAASSDTVDLSDPDSDDMDALTNEFFSVYNSAAAIIAAAPGMADLLAFLGIQ